jgi:hypothetical protein
MHYFISVARINGAAPEFSRAEVLLALLIGLVVAFATARPTVLDDGVYGPKATAWMRLSMASLVISASGLVFLVLRGGLGHGTQLGTPDTQYVTAGAILLGVFAAALHLEPLVFRWPGDRESRPRFARVCALLGPLAVGGAFVLTVRTAGVHGRTYEHLSEKLPLMPFVALLLVSGIWMGSKYVDAYAKADADQSEQDEKG